MMMGNGWPLLELGKDREHAGRQDVVEVVQVHDARLKIDKPGREGAACAGVIDVAPRGARIGPRSYAR